MMSCYFAGAPRNPHRRAETKSGPFARPRASGSLRRGRRAARAVAFYASKQFVLVGATMPNAGTKNMEGHVQRLFPAAEWLRAELGDTTPWFAVVGETPRDSSRGRERGQRERR